MNESNYQDTQKTLTEAVLVLLAFAVDFEHVFVCNIILRNNKL